jgi:RimJ/RimL family protein N-acetyltransferase
MGAYRASTILAAITGREVYPREQRIAFQEFGVPERDAGESELVHHEPSPVGDIELRPVDPDADAALLHRWVTDPKAVFWMMQEASVADVRREFKTIAAADGHEAFLGSVDREPRFLVERYDPGRSELAKHRRFGAGDVGMHVLVAPTDRPVPGFTAAVMAETMRFCFADPAVERVVVEPDARNDRIAALNAAAGFVVEEQLDLHDKTAVLSTCTRDQFAASRLGSRDHQTALKEASS